jgi:hypothetical protein
LERIASGLAEWAAIFAPLAVYFLFLARWAYRRGRPLILTGPVNRAWLWFAASGFLMLGPPSWVVFWVRSFGELPYWLAYGVYLAVLLLLAGISMARERNTLVILNLDPKAFAERLKGVLTVLGVTYTATPGRISLANGRAVLEIEASSLWNHVVLTWHGGDPNLWRELEGELRAALAEVLSPPGHAGTILSAIAFSLLLFLVFAVIVVRTFHPTW